jgi:DNA-binding transcriptional regulator YhcF (GntR family)
MRAAALAVTRSRAFAPATAVPAPKTDDLVERLLAGLTHGTWPVGARLPSVRILARDHRVSIATVLAAYGRMENRGLIERRARSGLFVRRIPVVPPEPAVSRPSSRIADPQ